MGAPSRDILRGISEIYDSIFHNFKFISASRPQSWITMLERPWSCSSYILNALNSYSDFSLIADTLLCPDLGLQILHVSKV